MMTNRPRTVTLGAALLAVLATTACTTTTGVAPPGDDDRITGAVAWYSAHAPQQNEAVAAAFAERFPDVELTVLRLVAGELAVRYSQERSAGSASADVVTFGDGEAVAEGERNGWWEAAVEAEEGFPAAGLSGGVMTTGILPRVIAVNTDLVPQGERPRSWEDLLAPAYADALLLADPRSAPSYLAMAQIWSEEYGDGFLTRLAAQNPQIIASTVPGNETLAAGGAKVVFPNSAPGILTVTDAGAPVKMIELSPTTGTEFYTVLSSEAEDSSAASAFYTFLTSADGQEAFNGPHGVSLREDTETARLPDGFIPLNDVLPAATERRAELLALLGIE